MPSTAWLTESIMDVDGEKIMKSVETQNATRLQAEPHRCWMEIYYASASFTILSTLPLIGWYTIGNFRVFYVDPGRPDLTTAIRQPQAWAHLNITERPRHCTYRWPSFVKCGHWVPPSPHSRSSFVAAVDSSPSVFVASHQPNQHQSNAKESCLDSFYAITKAQTAVHLVAYRISSLPSLYSATSVHLRDPHSVAVDIICLKLWQDPWATTV